MMLLVLGLLLFMLIPFAVFLAPFFVWIVPAATVAALFLIIKAALRQHFLRLQGN